MEAARQAYREICRKGDRDALILDHLPLVRHILGRLIATLPDHLDRENLESAGICGLVEAAGQFDESRGVAFTTFAYPRIRGAILDELRRNCPLPQQMLEKWARIRELLVSSPEPPTPESIAEATGLTLAEVEDCLRAAQLTRLDVWQDRFNDELEDGSEESAHHQLVRRELQRQLADAIEQLPDQMRLVVTLYYRNELRLREIGEVLGLSESRVSRILTRAELRLREIVQPRTE